MAHKLNSVKFYLLAFLVFIFPLIFFPSTQDIFITNKLYFLAFGVLILILISTIELIIGRKSALKLPVLDFSIVLIFIIGVIFSVIMASPNKVQAILNQNFGLLMIVSLSALYLFLIRANRTDKFLNFIPILNLSAIILAGLEIVSFFQPLKNIKLPSGLLFIKNPAFTPLGNQFDLLIFLGFFLIYQLFAVILNKRSDSKRSLIKIVPNLIFFVVYLTAIIMTVYGLFKPGSSFILPPFRLSWFAAIEVLKNFQTALFGIGVDNYTSVFTKVKDVLFNQSALWQISSFSLSSSIILHILTETGIIGLISFLLTIIISLQWFFTEAGRKLFKSSAYLIVYLALIIFLTPPSLVSFFLIFIILAELTNLSNYKNSRKDVIDIPEPYLTRFILVGLILILVGSGFYLLGRTYLAEYRFKKSIDAITANNAATVYNNQKQAVLLNPFNERFRLVFSQTNFLIADNVANKAKPPANNKQPAYQLTDQDRQTISQATQTAINEAKAVIDLNSQRADYWANLANLYNNILTVAQGADSWAISSYQRAIVLDPMNPIYRLNLGGVYYALNKFDDASSLFQQAISSKPDWTNAHYNLAWASFQKKDYQKAVDEMKGVLTSIDPAKQADNYKKVKAELEDFQKKLPEKASDNGTATEQKPNQLSLPASETVIISPKVILPTQAAPEK